MKPKYAQVVFKDELDELLEHIEAVTLEENSVNDELLMTIQEFIYRLDNYLSTEISECSIIDLRKCGGPN